LKHLQTNQFVGDDPVVIPFRYFAIESRIPQYWLLPPFGDRVGRVAMFEQPGWSVIASMPVPVPPDLQRTRGINGHFVRSNVWINAAQFQVSMATATVTAL
jgi:hypothetical protein